ncbi:MAG: Sb-PDE family phosphodiesterase [Bacteroidota bacterium]
MKINLKHLAAGIALYLLMAAPVAGQSRRNINLPDIQGYITLKGDFHMHTPFSDGTVWPSDRVLEAWRDGLDVIAITDHLEYSPNKGDVSTNHNRAYEIAKPVADEHGILLIQAAEITQKMPPGHFNALFLKDVNALIKTDYMESFKAAADQGAFFVWNHPGWKAQQPDTTLWFPKHTELYEKGWLNGIEVFNEKEYYPIVHGWAIDKKLTILGNTDIHGPIDFEYLAEKGEKRPFNIIFAKERTVEGVREAFVNHRTAACFNNTIAGTQEFLLPFVMQCVKVQSPQISINAQHSTCIVLNNPTDFPFELTSIKNDFVASTNKYSLSANSSIIINLNNMKGLQTGENEIALKFKVTNVLVDKEKPLEIELKLHAFAWNNVRIKKANEKEWTIDCGLNKPDLKVFYTLDGSIPTEKSTPISQNFTAKESALIKLACYRGNNRIGDVYENKCVLHQAMGQKISLKNDADGRYYANGAASLIDGVFGSDNYKDGLWLGFEQKDMEAVIEFDQAKSFKTITVNFLENTHSWIFLPSTVEVLVSNDGINFTSLGKTTFAASQEDKIRGITKAEINKQGKNVKFVKVIAKNIGTCPAWHSGNGKPAWMFVDEIMLK